MARPRIMATNVTTRKPIPTRSLKDRCFRKVVGLSVVRLVKEFVLNWADIPIPEENHILMNKFADTTYGGGVGDIYMIMV